MVHSGVLDPVLCGCWGEHRAVGAGPQVSILHDLMHKDRERKQVSNKSIGLLLISIRHRGNIQLGVVRKVFL